jgi:hypothetical protein
VFTLSHLKKFISSCTQQLFAHRNTCHGFHSLLETHVAYQEENRAGGRLNRLYSTSGSLRKPATLSSLAILLLNPSIKCLSSVRNAGATVVPCMIHRRTVLCSSVHLKDIPNLLAEIRCLLCRILSTFWGCDATLNLRFHATSRMACRKRVGKPLLDARSVSHGSLANLVGR